MLKLLSPEAVSFFAIHTNLSAMIREMKFIAMASLVFTVTKNILVEVSLKTLTKVKRKQEKREIKSLSEETRKCLATLQTTYLA